MLLNNFNDGDRFLEYLASNDALFHYTKKDIALEHILRNRELKFGSFLGTNDPQEYRSKLTGAVGWGWDTNTSEIMSTTTEIDNILQRRSRFLSFCINRYENSEIQEHGFLRSRMWAQYGDNHRGACIVVSKEKLLKILNSCLGTDQELFSSNVTYRNFERKELSILHVNGSDFDENNCIDIAYKFVLDNKDKYFFTKQIDYRDECEYRIVLLNKQKTSADDDKLLINIDEAVIGVIFGDRFPDIYTPTVKGLLKGTNMIAKKLIWNKSGYHVLNMWNDE